MNIDFLGCSGGIEAGIWQSTCYRIDRTLLVDCGTGAANMTLEAMRQIEHVLLTHAHLDHIACLPLMVDAVAERREAAPQVWAQKEVIAAVKTHILNDVIWPDVTRAPVADMILFPHPESGSFEVGRHRVEILPAAHGIPACGYLVREAGVSVAFSGDTGPCPEFWSRLSPIPDLAAVVVECSYPNREADVATATRHMHVDALLQSVSVLPDSVALVVVHRKPGRQSEIESELKQRLSRRTLYLPLGGDSIVF
jgi:ribonuclease BN (tRNA processing enzyme)